MKRICGRSALLAAILLLVGCDHATKLAATDQLQGGRSRTMIRGVLDLRYLENTDIGFNLLHAVPEAIRKPMLLIGGAIAIAVLLIALWRRPQKISAVYVGLILMAAGAIANYVDRLAHGHVVDFVHIHHWPVFNVADMYVTAGAALLVVAAAKRRIRT